MASQKKSVYIDTNVFVYARAFEGFSKASQTLQYYKQGEECINVLEACRQNGIAVFSSMISRIELYALYLDWSRRKRLIDLNLPYSFAFGEAHRADDEFIRSLFSPADRAAVCQETDEWFRHWGFSALVRWVDASRIPNWQELAILVLRYMSRRHIEDALHLGAAIGLECNKFFTKDAELRKVAEAMRSDTRLRRALIKDKLIDRDYTMPMPITDSKGLLP